VVGDGVSLRLRVKSLEPLSPALSLKGEGARPCREGAWL